jgi:hypothetical protein
VIEMTKKACFKVQVNGSVIVYVIAETMKEACYKVETTQDPELTDHRFFSCPFTNPVTITSCERLGGYAITE